MNTTAPRIVLLHATPVAMQPIADAMKRLWSQAQVINLLDDGLSLDRAQEEGGLSETLMQRFVDLGLYGLKSGADGILVTCSAFGPAVDALEDCVDVPVLRPNEAMFRAAIASGDNIGMLATFAPAVSTMVDEFSEFSKGTAAQLETFVVPRAIDLIKAGDIDTHNRLVAEAAPRFANKDAIMLAHFSTSNAMAAVRATVSCPVFSAPDAAVLLMKELVTGQTD
ncbi:aspartate/glutamate racemase family protein [uncultured Cohaesibacter sp.]|uniref:aspartate/glutamate racemase family protein n=1 Tax=uncultured Cohaesibacter sp. TaxID=1002546 RepID=UPI0029C8F73E|nr:aspartate/glutamate racemase family protein [uncultured Cohaesibacter sp.]